MKSRSILVVLMVLAFPLQLSSFFAYPFQHANLAHLLLNCITLWSFAKPVERDLGVIRTLGLFLAAAYIGGATQLLVTPDAQILGASAGVFALVAFFATVRPGTQIGLVFVALSAPVMLVVLYAASLACVIFNWLPGVAHYAHLAGMVIGGVGGYLWARR